MYPNLIFFYSANLQQAAYVGKGFAKIIGYRFLENLPRNAN